MIGDRLFTVPELRRAVRLLAAFVADERAVATPEIQDCLEIYISGCRIVNERTAEADRLLGLGQRSEGLRQVQMEPDALAMFALLTFEHYKHLPKITEELALPLPPKLNAVGARRLNQAYSLEKEGEGLLQEHRTLALARAPLKRRLEVIRLLQRAEPQAAFWQDDIASYEAARFDEIRSTLAKPELREDWQTLRDLHEELSADVWQTACPLDLSDTVKKGMTRVRREAAQYELEPMTRKLERGIEDEDTEKVNALVEAAVKVQQKYLLSEDSPLLKPFWKASHWLKDMDREDAIEIEFRRAVKQLEKSLDENFEWYYVQEYYRIAVEFDRPIARGVLDKYRDRSKGSLWPWILLVGVILLVAAGGVAFLIIKIA